MRQGESVAREAARAFFGGRKTDMADLAVKHDYHLVKPSPWPLVEPHFRHRHGHRPCDLHEGAVRAREAHLVGAQVIGLAGVLFTMV